MMLNYCNNMKVFISYASEDKLIAKKLYLALSDENCVVFFDEDSVKSGNFRKKIIDAIDNCDLFIFLVSYNSLNESRFAQAELSRAKQIFPSPEGRIIPVIVNNNISFADLAEKDPYLTSNHVVMSPGDVIVKTVNAVNDARFLRTSCKALITILAITSIIAIGFLLFYIFSPSKTDIGLLVPKKVEFRTLKAPPLCDKPDPNNTEWLNVDTGITAFKMVYLNRTSPTKYKKVRVLEVKASLFIEDNEPIEYEWSRILDVRNAANHEGGPKWISDVAEAEPFTIKSGNTRSDELLFKPIRYKSNPWETFVGNQIKNNYPSLSLSFEAYVEYFGLLGNTRKWINTECNLVVVKETRKEFSKFLKKCNRYPGYFVAHCK